MTIDVKLDLFAEIERLKKERNAVILAHYYQNPTCRTSPTTWATVSGCPKKRPRRKPTSSSSPVCTSWPRPPES